MSELITLLLAWKMAIAYKKDESKAIYMCSNRIWKDIKATNVKHLVMQLADKNTSNAKRIQAMKNLESAMKAEKLI